MFSASAITHGELVNGITEKDAFFLHHRLCFT